jgi:Uma2 family endonuclease
MIIQKEMTAEEFLIFAELHEDKRFDFIDGEIVEVSPTPVHSRKQVILANALELYTEQHPIGVVYTEVLLVLNGEKFLPDVCVAAETDASYLTTPPLLVVEIRSESQSRESQRRKARDYIRLGVKMVGLVLPGENVEVFLPGREALVLSVDDVLDGEDVLPDFRLPLSRILP